MMNLIIPIAGRSSRFPNMNPKWSLTHPRGDMMVIEAIKGLNLQDVSKIVFIGLQEQDVRLHLVEALSIQLEALGLKEKTEFVLLEESTRNQPETIAQGLRKANVTGPIYIKDSDNHFRDVCKPVNAIAGFDLHSLEKVNARSKSYYEVNADGYITNIVEKRIVSNRFCAGGYSFASAEEFLKYYDRLSADDDLYISHIVFSMILDGVMFTQQLVEDYLDWGTLKEWRDYTQLYSTLFIDLDGTLVRNSSQYSQPRWGETEGIQENIDAINALFDSDRVEVIITTSRKESFKSKTEQQLARVGLKYHKIIYGLPHGKRIVVNDYAPSNPYKSCDAINIRRNSSDLKEMLEDSIGFSLEIKRGDSI